LDISHLPRTIYRNVKNLRLHIFYSCGLFICCQHDYCRKILTQTLCCLIFYVIVKLIKLCFLFLKVCNQVLSFLPNRYSPGWALASSILCLQASRFLALSLHMLPPIFVRYMDTLSSHLILGLPLRLVAHSFPYSIILQITVSCILSICPSHLIIWAVVSYKPKFNRVNCHVRTFNLFHVTAIYLQD
jgi:hypothetical protein